VEWSFRECGIELEWKGNGVNEKGIDKATGKALVHVDKEYFRPAEVDLLVGDASKAKKVLGWEPKYTVEELCKEMVASDLRIFERDKYLMDAGHDVNKFHE
jgi:GDPmannose 4,6-dehydratase